MSRSGKDISVLSISDCEEIKFSYFWIGDVDLPEQLALVPQNPTVEDVRTKLVEKHIKDPVVVKKTILNKIIFGWIDFADIDNVSIESGDDSDEEEEGESIQSSCVTESSLRVEFDNSKNSLLGKLNAITHAFALFSVLCEELKSRRKVDLNDELKNEIEEASEKFSDHKDDLAEKIHSCEDSEDLKEGEREVRDNVTIVHGFLRRLVPEKPFVLPNLQDLRALVERLQKERDESKSQSERLQKECDECKSQILALKSEIRSGQIDDVHDSKIADLTQECGKWKAQAEQYKSEVAAERETAASKINDLNDQITDLVQKKDELESRMKETTDQTADWKLKAEAFEQQVKESIIKQHVANSKIENLEAEKRQLQEEIEKNEEAKKKHRAKLKKVEDEKKDLEMTLDTANDRIAKIEEDFNRQTTDLQSLMAQKAQLEKDLVSARESANKTAELEQRIQAVNGQIGSLEAEKQKKQDEIDALKDQKSDLEKEKQRKQQEIESLQKNLRAEQEKNKSEIERLRKELEQAKERIAKAGSVPSQDVTKIQEELKKAKQHNDENDTLLRLYGDMCVVFYPARAAGGKGIIFKTREGDSDQVYYMDADFASSVPDDYDKRSPVLCKIYSMEKKTITRDNENQFKAFGVAGGKDIVVCSGFCAGVLDGRPLI